MYILFIVFFNPQYENEVIEFNNRTSCIEAQRKLRDSRLNAWTWCLAKEIKGLGELDD